jgi:hypothetical protein
VPHLRDALVWKDKSGNVKWQSIGDTLDEAWRKAWTITPPPKLVSASTCWEKGDVPSVEQVWSDIYKNQGRSSVFHPKL